MTDATVGTLGGNDNAPLSDADKFKAAYRRYELAHAAMVMCNAEGVLTDADDEWLDEYDRKACRIRDNHIEAFESLLLTISPDVRALRTKIHIFHRENLVDGWRDAPLLMAAIVHDADRLLS